MTESSNDRQQGSLPYRTLGETIACNIAHAMAGLDLGYDDLADLTDIPWSTLVGYRGDAAGMTIGELQSIGLALGVGTDSLTMTRAVAEALATLQDKIELLVTADQMREAKA